MGWLLNALAVAAGLLFGVYLLGRYFASPNQVGFAADPNALVVSLCIIAFFGLCLWITVPVVVGYARMFKFDEEGLTEHLFGRGKRIAWRDLEAANRIVEADRGSSTEFANRVGIELIGGGVRMRLYQGLHGYDFVRRRVSAECKARGIPMREKDSSWEVSRRLPNARLWSLMSREGWRRTYLERQITEL